MDCRQDYWNQESSMLYLWFHIGIEKLQYLEGIPTRKSSGFQLYLGSQWSLTTGSSIERYHFPCTTRTCRMLRRTNLILLIGLLACMDIHNVAAFLKPRIVPAHGNPTTLFSTEVSEDFVTTANTPTTDWELDCYSRPVLVDGKKLWEVLITDSSNSFRY